MRTTLLAALLALPTVACNGKGNDSALFGGGGSSGLDEDDGSTEQTDDPSPRITNVVATFTTVGNFYALAVRVDFTDPQDDVYGGILHVDIKADGAREEIRQYPDGDLPINNFDVILEEGQLVATFQDIRTDVQYDVSTNITDYAGNQSETVSATCDPMS